MFITLPSYSGLDHPTHDLGRQGRQNQFVFNVSQGPRLFVFAALGLCFNAQAC